MPGLVVAPVADQQPFGVVESALSGHRVQDRAVRLGDRDRDRQPAARFGAPEQHVRERVAHGLPGQPAVATAATWSAHGMSTGMPAFTTTMVRSFTAATRRTSSS